MPSHSFQLCRTMQRKCKFCLENSIIMENQNNIKVFMYLMAKFGKFQKNMFFFWTWSITQFKHLHCVLSRGNTSCPLFMKFGQIYVQMISWLSGAVEWMGRKLDHQVRLKQAHIIIILQIIYFHDMSLGAYLGQHLTLRLMKLGQNICIDTSTMLGLKTQ